MGPGRNSARLSAHPSLDAALVLGWVLPPRASRIRRNVRKVCFAAVSSLPSNAKCLERPDPPRLLRSQTRFRIGCSGSGSCASPVRRPKMPRPREAIGRHCQGTHRDAGSPAKSSRFASASPVSQTARSGSQVQDSPRKRMGKECQWPGRIGPRLRERMLSKRTPWLEGNGESPLRLGRDVQAAEGAADRAATSVAVKCKELAPSPRAFADLPIGRPDPKEVATKTESAETKQEVSRTQACCAAVCWRYSDQPAK